MNKREMIRRLKKIVREKDAVLVTPEDDPMREEPIFSHFLGTWFELDPCGRYHHVLSPNGLTKRCENYWERLEEAANEAGGWTEAGEGNATDIFFCWLATEEDIAERTPKPAKFSIRHDKPGIASGTIPPKHPQSELLIHAIQAYYWCLPPDGVERTGPEFAGYIREVFSMENPQNAAIVAALEAA